MTSLSENQVITASGGLVELGYSQITSAVSITNSTYGTGTEVITPLTVVCDGSPVLVEFFSQNVYLYTPPAIGDVVDVALWYDGAEYTRYWGRRQADTVQATGGAFYVQYRITPSAGVHTFGVKAVCTGGASRPGGVNAGTGGVNPAPAYLRVSKIVQATQWPAVTTGTIICTSSTRPASPFEGQQIYEGDTKKMLVWNGSAWRTFAETDATIGTPLQIVQTQHSSATQNGGAGSNYSNYAGLQTTFTTGGSSRVLIDGMVGSIQPSTANSMAIVKCDYDSTSLDPAVTTNMVAGTSAEWSHSGYDLKNMPFSGITPVLAAGTYTFRVKVRSPQAVTLQWNWHSYAEQRSWLTLTEVAA